MNWKVFDWFITTVILINSVLLGVKDYNGRLLGPDYVSVINDNTA